MKIKELPKSAIQIEQDSLLLEVNRLKNVLQQREQDITNLKTNLSKTSGFEHSLSQKEHVIQNLENQLKIKDVVVHNQSEKIITLEKELNSPNPELELLRKSLEDKSLIITFLQTKSGDYKEKIVNLTNELSSKSLILEQIIEDKNSTISFLETKNNEFKEEISELTKKLDVYISSDALFAESIVSDEAVLVLGEDDSDHFANN